MPDTDDEPETTDSSPSDTDVYVDRDKIDFDPDDGLLTGTAIDGGTDIPGPHENVDDVEPDESGESGDADDDDNADDDDAEDDS